MHQPSKEAFYDSLYEAGKDVLRGNPCQITKHPDGRTTCLLGKLPDECCNGCRHLGPEGCTVEALGCKLELCDVSAKANPEVWLDLKMLKAAATSSGIPLIFRASKDQHFGRDKDLRGCWSANKHAWDYHPVDA